MQVVNHDGTMSEKEVFDLIVETTEISEIQAIQYINNNGNPEKNRNQLKDVLQRYRSSNLKFPNRVKIIVNRFGKAALWMD